VPGGWRIALWGAEDPELGRSLGAALREAAPDAELVLTDGTAPIRAEAVVVMAAAAPEAGAATVATLGAFAGGGGPVLGIGPGVAVLCQAGLLSGRVEPLGREVAPPTHVRVEGRATSFTWAIPAGRVLELEAEGPAAHQVAPAAVADDAAGCVVLRYCDGAGGVRGGGAIAGVCDAQARVVGLLPGLTVPARALAGSLGRQLWGSLRLALAGRWR